MLEVFARMLRDEGVGVTAVKDGLSALSSLAEQRFDILLADQCIPGPKGSTVLEHAALRWPQMVRALMTRDADPTVCVMAANRGRVSRVIFKTLAHDWLRTLLAEIVTEAYARTRALEAARPDVVIVEDDPDLLGVFERMLRRDFTVRSASKAAEALTQMERQPADVILSDVMMPGSDGIALLSEVAERWPDTYRVVMTGHASPDILLKAINEASVHRMLVKPIAGPDIRAVFAGLKAEIVGAVEGW